MRNHILFQWISHRTILYSVCGGQTAAQLILRKGGIPMEDHEEVVWTRLDKLPAPRHGGGRWLLIGGLALAFMLALGVGVLIGSSTGAAQAAVRSRFTRQRVPATPRLVRLSLRAPSRLAPGLTSWGRTTAMAALPLPALTSADSGW